MIRNQARSIALLLLISFCSVTPSIAAEAPRQITLQVTDTVDGYVLSVPVSRLVMTIPKGHLVQVRETASGLNESPRYFFLEDKGRALIVSGWFESSEGYSDFNKYWKEEKDSWRSQKLPTPVNEKFFKSGGWEGVFYDIAASSGANSHIRAHWVQAGTWIDLHISLTSKSANSRSREQLLEFLKTIQVKQRS